MLINVKTIGSVLFLTGYLVGWTTITCIIIDCVESYQKLHNWKIITLCYTYFFWCACIFPRSHMPLTKRVVVFIWDLCTFKYVRYSLILRESCHFICIIYFEIKAVETNQRGENNTLHNKHVHYKFRYDYIPIDKTSSNVAMLRSCTLQSLCSEKIVKFTSMAH